MKSLIRRRSSKPVKAGRQYTPGPCLNCGTYLWGNDHYCPNCGQKRLEPEDLSFSRMIVESFFDYFHFDSKFFRTIVPLLFKPGYLTLEYMKGKRKSYGEPFRLFLVISIIYFLLLPLSRDSEEVDHKRKPDTESENREKPETPRPSNYTIRGIRISSAGQDSIRKEIDTIGLRTYVDKHFGDENRIVKLLLRQTFKILVYSGQSFGTIMEHTASKMIFLLIPVFALLLKLIYLRGKRLYYEHLIFSLHIHAFVFLMLIIALLIGFLVHVSMLIVIAIALVYLFFALKINYTGSNGRTLRKFFLLILFYSIIGLPIFFLLLVLVSVFVF